MRKWNEYIWIIYSGEIGYNIFFSVFLFLSYSCLNLMVQQWSDIFSLECLLERLSDNGILLCFLDMFFTFGLVAGSSDQPGLGGAY